MVVAEFFAGITSLRTALDMTKAMIGLRDAEAFRAKSIELQGVVLEALEKAIEAREAYAEQADRIRTLETEVTDLKAWGAEKEKYELKTIGYGAVAYMLKPEARGTEPPHWLCPNCHAQGKKGFLQTTGRHERRATIYVCPRCNATVATEDGPPAWID
jgi:hypothetical protein